MNSKRPTISAKQRAEIFRDNNGICHLCVRKIAHGEPWEVEHVKARGLGGLDIPENMKPAHIDCHKGKTKRDRQIMSKADRQMKANVLPRQKSKWPSRPFGQQNTSRVKQLEEL